MADKETNVADEEQVQDDGQPTATPTTGTDQATTEAATPEARFTQADMDKAIKERLARERRKLKDATTKQYGDYDELKKAAVRLQELEDSSKTEQEKLSDQFAATQAQLAELQDQNARLAQEASEARLRSDIVAQATAMDFVDPMDAWRLIDVASIEVDDDGQPTGIEEKLKAIAENKPYLLRQAPQGKLSPTNPGHGKQAGESRAEKKARLWGIGETPIGQSGGGVLAFQDFNEMLQNERS